MKKQIIIVLFLITGIWCKSSDEAKMMKGKSEEYKKAYEILKKYDVLKAAEIVSYVNSDKGEIINANNKDPDKIDIFNSGNKFTNEGMKGLVICKNLRTLNLNYSKVTDEGLKIIPELKSLTDLSMQLVNYTDKGIESISKSSSIKQLALDSDKVTNQTLEYLMKMPNLLNVNFGLEPVFGSHVSKVLLKKFGKILDERAEKYNAEEEKRAEEWRAKNKAKK